MSFVHWDECSFKEKLARFQNAERVLVNLPKHQRTKHWNMAHWGIVTDCGTVCCAAGHCGLDPWFRKRGLKLKPITFKDLIAEEFDDSDVDVPRTLDDAEEIGIAHGYGGFEDDVSVGEFFGSRSDTIFGNDSLRTVNTVIKEIRQRIKEMKQDEIYWAKLRTKEIKAIKVEMADLMKRRLKEIEESYTHGLKQIG